jgi:hypothetical protein
LIKLLLREQALQAVAMRNEIKMQARELMIDQELAVTLLPPETLKNIVKKAYKDNQVGEDLWRTKFTKNK